MRYIGTIGSFGVDSVPQCSDVPTLMLSPHDDRYRVVQALKAGADGYLLRPFSPKELAAAIDKALDRSAVA